MKFTLEQIREAHASVKTGADFPAYIQEMKKLGVQSYEHFVSDGHIIYLGIEDFILSAPPKWDGIAIASKAQKDKLQQEIKIHQEGLTGLFPRSAGIPAEAGVEKWLVDMQNMMCIYYDPIGNEMIAEPIPRCARAYSH